MVDATVTMAARREAGEPPEARGLRRDQVRLLVSDVVRDTISHTRFDDLPAWLEPGDLLVVNTSATIGAALPATAPDGEDLVVHLSTRLPGGFWVVEIRKVGPSASLSTSDNRVGTALTLPEGGSVTPLAPYPTTGSIDSPSRLWLSAFEVKDDVMTFAARQLRPIRYSYVGRAWPLSMYQTVFALEPGSAEMPSACRPFTPELVTSLVTRGVQIAPLLLHTGVSSQEWHEPPYEEFYRVPSSTAEQVNIARRRGHHVVAVGTTVVRALETVTDERGVTSAGEGWTTRLVTPERPPRATTALITGLHDPAATHLQLIEALADAHPGPSARSALERAYRQAREAGYLWHEFGDSHLILGDRS